MSQSPALANDLGLFARRLGDDALVLGQRLCEWCSNAPMLEEELAIANIALDYLGRARMCYAYAGEILGQTEDHLAFLRDAKDMENLLVVELPRGDFAFSCVRQFLIDEFEVLYFSGLKQSAEPQIAAIAEKTFKEISYHQRRSRHWLRRLGLGTPESQQRTQVALDSLWGYCQEFFLMDHLENRLCQTGHAVDRAGLTQTWQAAVLAHIAACNLVVPEDGWAAKGGRQGVHTEHLGHLLAEMQVIQRSYPGLNW